MTATTINAFNATAKDLNAIQAETALKLRRLRMQCKMDDCFAGDGTDEFGEPNRPIVDALETLERKIDGLFVAALAQIGNEMRGRL